MKTCQIVLLIALAAFFASCHSAEPASGEAETEMKPQTPVSITTVGNEPLMEYIELTARSSYMQKSVVKASINGYIQTENAKKGRYVSAGQTLFRMITKEARAIGNTINKLDPSFNFSGISSIKASQGGYISDLNHQRGDYVQEGEQLAVISNRNSFVFLMDVPYEYNNLVKNGQSVQLLLPDGTKLTGYVASALPSVDSVSQTQGFAIKVNTSKSIPEGLIAKVRVLKTAKTNAVSLPKSAILTDETEEEFWVMKMINDTTAVKVSVKKGIEVGDKVEIVSPKFNPNDRIVTVGNYGLADTAKVKITGK